MKMGLKKSELYSSLWKSCDELRGGMDASQYKDYILVLLFFKYVSDKYSNNPNASIIVPAGASFKDLSVLKGQKDIGDKINKIISKLADENDLRSVIDVADFNDSNKLGSGKEMQDRLTRLIGIFENPALNFSNNNADGDDLLGDAYEYLMRHFATESGKSKGQFYTPAEVSQVMAKVIGINKTKSQTQTIYDPTCGSGSLLLKAAAEAPKGVTIYGQEMDNATRALAKMNMILHDHPSADIQQGNTIAHPKFKDQKGQLKAFDFVVSNPPFSSKSWSNGLDPLHDEFERFSYGIPPTKNGDYAFLLHLIRSLKSTGTGAIVLPHGVLFRGNAEADIRKNIIKNGYIKGIISLPANLFYGTGIPACIIVIDKENAKNRKSIFMIDASKGFIKDGNKNRLRHQDIHKIVDYFNKQIEEPKYSRLVALEDIEKNDFNLNIPRYIDSSEEEDIQDIGAHLYGGIPNHDIDNLAKYWQVYPKLRNELFKEQRSGYSELLIEPSQIKQAIYHNPEFIDFTKTIEKIFKHWIAKNENILKAMKIGIHPKEIIAELSEDLLDCFAQTDLLDRYDVYQHLMMYWAEVMQDDVYLISQAGWQANEDLIPAELIIKRYFAKQQQDIENLNLSKDEICREREELEEECSGDDGCLEELKSDKGKISKASLQKRIKEIQHDPEAKEELAVLVKYMTLVDRESDAVKSIKLAVIQLQKKVTEQYKSLNIHEIKSLIVNDKWMATIYLALKTEMERISQGLTQRIKEIAERYNTPLPQLTLEVKKLSSTVNKHLKSMGFDISSL